MKQLLNRLLYPAAAAVFLALALLSAAALRQGARAQDTLRAVAVVNDEVISMLDLYMRTRLAMLSSGIQATGESQARIERQVLRRLIDERLQVQEAARLSLEVTDDDVQQALQEIARRNGMSTVQFENMLQQNQILPMAMEDQIKAELAWNNVVKVRLVPTVIVGDDEIDEVIARLEANRGGTEVDLYEIYFEVDSVLQEDEVRRTALGLMEQLRGGGDFTALATQFSQSATAAQGGSMGWLEESQLPDEIASVVRSMTPGQVTGPVRGLTGFQILYLKQRRTISGGDSKIRLTQIFLELPAGGGEAELAAARQEAEDLRAQIDSCDDAVRIAGESGAPGSGDLGLLAVEDLSPDLRNRIEGLPLEQPSAALEIGGALAIFVVCERQGGGFDRARIERSLLGQRVEILARRYLRDLRRQANVDLRL